MIKIIIALLVGLFIGTFIGIVLTALMSAAGREDVVKEYTSFKGEIENFYCFLNDHHLAIAPDETTPESEYEFRKGMATAIEQCLNSLREILK